MRDMFKKACRNEYPNFYRNPFGDWEVREGTIIEYEDDFPTADEMRKRKGKCSVADQIILDIIKATLKEVSSDVNQIFYEGELPSTVKKYLYERGYKIDCSRQYNDFYTKISW